MILTSLVCKKHLEMAHCCLDSVLKNVQGITELRLFDDGSLGEDEFESFQALSTKIKLIKLKDRNAQVSDLLANYPNCRRYRESSNFAYKLFDCMLLSENVLTFIDCDILFIKKMNIADLDIYPLFFLKENDIAYSGTLRAIKKVRGKQIPAACNAGFTRMNKDIYDLDYIEYFLGEPKYLICQHLAEQTVIALLFGYENSFQLDHKQFVCDKDKINIYDETIAIHFIHNLKKEWQNYAHLVDTKESATPIAHPAQKLNYYKITVRRLKREIENIKGKFSK